MLSAECSVDVSDVVAVLDMDRATVSQELRLTLSRAEKAGRVVNAAVKLPKSLVFTKDGKIYISPLMAQTVRKRCGERLNDFIHQGR
ncbi:MAG: DUF370 domain-containing protein [Clostridia bacterium]|nr:DUF370 domain-containing protein [Clostridia bacterium]